MLKSIKDFITNPYTLSGIAIGFVLLPISYYTFGVSEINIKSFLEWLISSSGGGWAASIVAIILMIGYFTQRRKEYQNGLYKEVMNDFHLLRQTLILPTGEAVNNPKAYWSAIDYINQIKYKIENLDAVLQLSFSHHVENSSYKFDSIFHQSISFYFCRGGTFDEGGFVHHTNTHLYIADELDECDIFQYFNGCTNRAAIKELFNSSVPISAIYELRMFLEQQRSPAEHLFSAFNDNLGNLAMYVNGGTYSVSKDKDIDHDGIVTYAKYMEIFNDYYRYKLLNPRGNIKLSNDVKQFAEKIRKFTIHYKYW